jgi:predicted TIM-barrel fold metal-dependent hydrolase
LRALEAGQVWVKLSAPYRIGSLNGVSIQPYVDALVVANPKQLVWASDWPWLSYENQFTYADCLTWIQSTVDDSAIWEDIFIHNPKTLFHF